jgi:hypothetical protein
MRSQVRFVMHPDDEREFVDDLLRDDSVGLINGPRWKASEPTVHRSLESIDTYCIIWSKKDLAQLDAEFIPECNDWYCGSEGATIQFFRSRINGSVLTEGRLAVGTNSQPIEIAQVVDERYLKLRKFIKKRYRNNMLRWRNPTLPSPATAGRSSNPSKPDNSVWIGLAALNWLEADSETRRVKQFTSSIVEGELALETATGAPVSGRS